MIDHLDAVSRFADARSRIDLGGRTPVQPSYLAAFALPCRAPHPGTTRPAAGMRARFAPLEWLASRQRGAA